ncbi:transmembrane channel-like protein 7 isoform X3 [Acanthochromis polyacanthus]|uniref:transmembrane channel-like protein 7 isoform X3 n=1 Tax=Acanthochromis polyacanthus TaxID=80966 RepID=UPI000B8FF06C|nr:transmembrane channel-like protein 7 isoform X3 [Acanthochromis polyacanthus]
MEEHETVNFLRLLSEESTQSTLSSDSCEYYQTEIFDQLPSVQASRPEQNRYGHLEACEAYQGGPESGERINQGHPSRGQRDKTSEEPLRNLAMCIQGKRSARERRKMQISNIGFWESWRRSQIISRRRVWAQMGEALSGLLPWRHTLHIIEGRFGVGVKSYFVFLRYLVHLNLLHCALIGGFILGPTIFYGRGSNSKPLRFGGNDSVLDFFLGTGYLDRSPVFYGFYTRGSLDLKCLNTPLLYLAGILTILLLSLIMVFRRTTVGYKHTWMLGKRYSMNVSYKIFCGWDFTIQDPAAASLKHSFIRNDLKLFLEEQSFSLRAAQRTLGLKIRLYLLRFILNLLVLSLLGGAFYLIYFSTKISQYENEHNWLVSLVLQYLPPITITFVNLVLPHIFRKISSFEDYSFTTQVNTTLVRSIFLKLASLGIYLFFVFTTEQQQAAAGEVSHISADPVVGETTLSDPLQCAGSGVQSDCVLGGSLLLPSAASDRNRHTDGNVLHQKVQCPALLCGRAADVSSLHLLSFVPLHAAAWSLHGCSHTGIQPLPLPLPARTHIGHEHGFTVLLWSVWKWRNCV